MNQDQNKGGRGEVDGKYKPRNTPQQHNRISLTTESNVRGANSWPTHYVQLRKKRKRRILQRRTNWNTDALELEKCKIFEDKPLKMAEQKANPLWVPSFVRETQGLLNRQDPPDYTEHSAVINFEIWYKKNIY